MKTLLNAQRLKTAICVIAGVLTIAANTALAQNPLAEALKVPGAKPTLPVSAAKKPFDNAFIAEAHKYWSNFHMQMGGDHALYYTSHLSEFLPMALTPPVGEVSKLKRSPVASVKQTTFVRGNGSTSIPPLPAPDRNVRAV